MEKNLTKDDINTSKIFWAFWQKSCAYIYNEELACLFTIKTKIVDDQNKPVTVLGEGTFNHKVEGTFYLYSVHKGHDGKVKLAKNRVLRTFSMESTADMGTVDEFKKIALSTCYNQYMTAKYGTNI